jgi:hypothetical protein
MVHSLVHSQAVTLGRTQTQNGEWSKLLCGAIAPSG